MTDRKTVRTIAAATIGNALEFFDFTVFTAYAAYIGDYFFGSTDDYVRILQAVSVFGLGFVARPLGALLIGYYADTRGRKAAMTLTLVSMFAAVADPCEGTFLWIGRASAKSGSETEEARRTARNPLVFRT